MADRFDYLIVGQGLAGTALAWHLRWAGFRVAVIDREAAVTSSRVAAGLITPITGRRLAVSWRFAELFPAAEAFYRRVESGTGTRFYTRRPTVRLIRDERERAVFAERAATEFRGLVNPVAPRVDEEWFAAPYGGFEMTAAGRLAVAAYLDASRTYFSRDGGYRTGDAQPGADVELEPSGVRLPRLGVTARRIIFCQGIDGMFNPWFRHVPFSPAKGEILTLSVNGLGEERVINRGVWFAPTGDGTYRAGATYDRDNLDCTPTARGRDEVCSRLGEFLRRPFAVTGHAAAVRPITATRKPALGLHPRDDRIGFFNGLGSKGSLVAPYYAARFVGALTGGPPLDSEVDVGRQNRHA